MNTNIAWEKILGFDTPVLEVVVRGTLMYLGLFTLLRVVLKRQSGGMGITDLLVVVLLADAAQNGMAGEYTSVGDGMVLVAVILFWSYALDWLGFHIPWFQRLISSPPLPLVRDGRMLRKNMRQELVTEEELMVQLRQQGVEELDKVRVARMESDGRISVITHDEEVRNGKSEKKKF